jgi:hypothetical protein
MRVLVSLLLASIPVCAGTLDITATCDGVVYPGAYSCSDGSLQTPGPYANVDGSYLQIEAGIWLPPGGTIDSASASFTGEYVLDITGGSGSGHAEPLWWFSADNYLGTAAMAGISATMVTSMGSCYVVSIYPEQNPQTCDSLPFTFGVPQMVTISLFAGASASVPAEVNAFGWFDGFYFFDSSGNPTSATYSLAPIELTPEPATWLLAATAFAALVTLARPRA